MNPLNALSDFTEISEKYLYYLSKRKKSSKIIKPLSSNKTFYFLPPKKKNAKQHLDTKKSHKQNILISIKKIPKNSDNINTKKKS